MEVTVPPDSVLGCFSLAWRRGGITTSGPEPIKVLRFAYRCQVGYAKKNIYILFIVHRKIMCVLLDPARLYALADTLPSISSKAGNAASSELSDFTPGCCNALKILT